MSNTSVIAIRDLSKTYVVPEREAGLGAALKSLFHRQTREVKAVQDITFDLAPGEIVGFLGPNGAGKTTTLKMLSGLLYPTSGDVSVLGHTPFKREKAYLSQITLVMGQRNQLIWDIPVAFAVTVPAEALIGRLDAQTLALDIGVAAFMLVGSRYFWKFGLRNYSGASA